MHVHTYEGMACRVSVEVRRRHWIPWRWSYIDVSCSRWVLGTKEQKVLLITEASLQAHVFMI